jgi:hypothetical protein
MYTEEEMDFALCKTVVLREYAKYTTAEELAKVMNLDEVVLCTLHIGELDEGMNAFTLQKFAELASTFDPGALVKRHYYNDLVAIKQYTREQLITKLTESLQHERARANMDEKDTERRRHEAIAALPRAAGTERRDEGGFGWPKDDDDPDTDQYDVSRL